MGPRRCTTTRLYTAHELEGPFADHGAKVAVFWDNTADIAQHLVDTTPLEKVFTVNITKSMPLLLRLAFPAGADAAQGEGEADGWADSV